MNVFLLAGLGPKVKYENLFSSTVLSLEKQPTALPEIRTGIGHDILEWSYWHDGVNIPVLRPRQGSPPILSTAIVTHLFQKSGCDVVAESLATIWKRGVPSVSREEIDLVAVSTTFICNFFTLDRVMSWIKKYFCGKNLVIGGQFSNLKARDILKRYDTVTCVIRGDGEVAVPKLIRALTDRSGLAEVPNVAVRCKITGRVVATPIQYCDLNTGDLIPFNRELSIVPYESMRGCPFSCGFCSFPSASPKWRYKTTERMMHDFRVYQDMGVRHIRAMDSTFSVPGYRFRNFSRAKKDLAISWECYSRANAVSDPATIDELEESALTALSVGFESMSDRVLKIMNKGVAAKYNYAAAQALDCSEIATRVSFMVGYPGETPEDFEETYKYLTAEFPLRFMLSVFSPLDETMPVWDDQETHQLELLEHSEDSAPRWRHSGMDSDVAEHLMISTLTDARWKNDLGVHLLWQAQWELPILPDRSRAENQRIEKAIERYVFGEIDFADSETSQRIRQRILSDMTEIGIQTGSTLV